MSPRAAVLLLACALCACGKDDIQVYRLAKSDKRPAPPPLPAPGTDLAWTVPAGWSEEPATGMRAASYRVPGGAELSVVVLPGDVGGPKANIDRWRGQVGLAPLSEGAFAGAVSRLASPAGELLTVDFAGAGASSERRVAAAILARGGRTWFFKLTGPQAAVAAAKPAFAGFLRGLRSR